MKEIILPYALKNASDHGKANPKAVLAKVLGERPDLRGRAREVMAEVEVVVAEVNTMSSEDISRKAGEHNFEKTVKNERGLAELPDAEAGKVRLRFAPNPSGPLHLGHARAAVLNDVYAKKYDGRLILRFEDTDPKRVDPDAYEMIRNDLEWLGVAWQEEVLQSDRLELYYRRARELVSKSLAYVCTCRQEVFKALRESDRACECRDTLDSPEAFEKMFTQYCEGEAVLRLKTDLAHKNVSIRDFPIMRIVDTPHPCVSDKKVYPLMNLSVPVDDHELGLTHILRGKDHILNTHKQAYIYDYLGWEKPHYIHYGLLKIRDVMLSTSEMKKGIEDGVYSGWDDVRLGTLAALRRRGIKPDAIKKVMFDVGVKQTDITFSWKNLYAQNKKLIDPVANRYSFVETRPDSPSVLRVVNCPEWVSKNRLHPTYDRGDRRVDLNSGSQDFLLNDSDFSELKEGNVVRLMGTYNIKVTEKSKNIADAVFHSKSLEEARANKARLINWVKSGENIGVEVLSPEGVHHLGFAERDILKAKEGW
ncbi:MAG: glutamate--tRNA ligase, partial [Candidatus Hydrothermarchaeales archaeon]